MKIGLRIKTDWNIGSSCFIICLISGVCHFNYMQESQYYLTHLVSLRIKQKHVHK